MSNPRDLVHFLIPQTDTARVKKDLDDFVSTWERLASFIHAEHKDVEQVLHESDCSERLIALHDRNDERVGDMRVLGEYLDAGEGDGWSFRWLHLTDELNVRTAYRRIMVDKQAVVFCLERVIADGGVHSNDAAETAAHSTVHEASPHTLIRIERHRKV